jgi:NAD+ kinase
MLWKTLFHSITFEGDFLKQIKKVFLFINYEKENVKKIVDDILDFFLQRNITVLVDKPVESKKCVLYDTENAIKNSDIIVSVGGDGTLIRVAKLALKYGTPILGVNLGRLGFLTCIEPEHIELLEEIISGEYKIQKRMVLEIEDKNETFYAINDAVITKGAISRIIDIDIFCDENKVTNLRADGVIFSTPTGSTAYSLSAGGPIIDSSLECILTTPICPHSLSARTIVFSPNTVLKAKIDSNNCEKAFLTIDGQQAVEIDAEHTLTVKKSSLYANFLLPKDRTFFETLNKKMKLKEN